MFLQRPDDYELKVARGKVVKTLLNDEVNGTKLGIGFVGVLIEEVIKKDEKLMRPYEEIKKIGDAEGCITAWSKKYLQLI